ncbi:hypothetical protein IQ265_16815 [Nodosilinea sp. LEGE 06152]|uniref:hypothetical protein n=1 Tax=Nodosilinea sp. LEGE 06152 TaxID=2777966 RepID=UPI00187EF46E|nr:hypothetical protein [Nodosilinea sp. LEGE 06152]MBE9158481.1 hypothetical protein [Nodosilinea sp. LEGE 06152]
MRHPLLDAIQQSDGRYLNDLELRSLAQFVTSFDSRSQTYLRLNAEGNTLVLNALRRLVLTHPEAVRMHGAKCQRDMLYTLECVAKAILVDSPDGFVEEYVLWMQNITRALHKQDSAIAAYRALQAEITSTLPTEAAQLVNSYLERLITALAQGL